ncbi:MAG: type II secretion system F family protein [Candidatus Nanohaloarchaea archaeon]
MERENSYKLKLKNFWREEKKLFLMIAGAAVLGATIAGANSLNHSDAINRFNLDSERQITNQKDVRIDFMLDRPNLQSETSLSLTFDRASTTNPVIVYLNGEKVEGGITSQDKTVDLPEDSLQENNTVRITRRDLGFNSLTVTDASVTSFTNMQQLAFVGLNFSAIVLIFLPLGYIKYRQFQRRQRMQEEFPEFLRDVVEGIRAGMPLPQAIQNVEAESYTGLEDNIEKMNSQMNWGVSFEEILEQFGERTGSDVVRRSVDTIIQAYSSGGNIQQVLESVGDNIRSVKKLKQERQSQLYGELVTGYIVYFIFIGILVALTNYLLPNLAQASGDFGSGGISLFGGGGGGGNLQQNISKYKEWFSRLVYVQAVFSGLIIGKLSEGEMKAGLKHVFVLFALGYLAVTFFL